MTHARPLLIDHLGKPEKIELLSPVAWRTTAGPAFREELIQGLVHAEPGCLPLHEIDAAFAGMKSVCRELPVQCAEQAGYIDNLLVNASGYLSLVECKLMANRESSREVVAQVLSYAAALSRYSYDDLLSAIARTKDRAEIASEDVLADRVLGVSATDDERYGFRQDVERHLRRGNFLLLVVGDRIRSGIEQIASLLQSNATLAFSFGLVEMPIYAASGSAAFYVQPRLLLRSEIVVRTIFMTEDRGQAAVVKKVEASGPPAPLSEADFFAELQQVDASYPQQLRQLLERLRQIDCDIRLVKKFNVYVENGSDPKANVGSFGRDATLEIWGSSARDADYGAPLGLRYMQRVADIFGGSVRTNHANPASWHVRAHDKLAIPLSLVLAKADDWIAAVMDFAAALRELGDRGHPASSQPFRSSARFALPQGVDESEAPDGGESNL